MNTKKTSGQMGSRSAATSTTTTPTTTGQSPRKPWVKKTPAEVVLAQIKRVREDVAEKEEELKLAKRQLEKLEQARKVLEAT